VPQPTPMLQPAPAIHVRSCYLQAKCYQLPL
jgi:hypothetical protein